MSSPRVSVVLPTRNRCTMLARAINSVLAQTFDDLELIVVDDGSTDDTSTLLASIDDPRLVCISLDVGGGAAAARNVGIRHARGEFVGFQDSDDVWLPEKLALQIAVFEDHTPAVGAVGGRWVAGDGAGAKEFAAPSLETGGDYEAELLDGHPLITPVWVVRRELLQQLGLFDEGMPCLEDWDLMLRLSLQTALRAVPAAVLVKYGAPDSLGADFDRRAVGLKELLDRHEKRFRGAPTRYASYCLELAYLSILRSRWRWALRYGVRALGARRLPRATLLLFVKASIGARLLRRPAWPVPGLAGD